MSCTANSRQERVFNGALQLFLHELGRGSAFNQDGPRMDELRACLALAVELEGLVESALKGDI